MIFVAGLSVALGAGLASSTELHVPEACSQDAVIVPAAEAAVVRVVGQDPRGTLTECLVRDESGRLELIASRRAAPPASEVRIVGRTQGAILAQTLLPAPRDDRFSSPRWGLMAWGSEVDYLDLCGGVTLSCSRPIWAGQATGVLAYLGEPFGRLNVGDGVGWYSHVAHFVDGAWRTVQVALPGPYSGIVGDDEAGSFLVLASAQGVPQLWGARLPKPGTVGEGETIDANAIHNLPSGSVVSSIWPGQRGPLVVFHKRSKVCRVQGLSVPVGETKEAAVRFDRRLPSCEVLDGGAGLWGVIDRAHERLILYRDVGDAFKPVIALDTGGRVPMRVLSSGDSVWVLYADSGSQEHTLVKLRWGGGLGFP